MEILNTRQPVIRLVETLKVTTDTPLPEETSQDVQAKFKLVELLERSSKALNRHFEIMLKSESAESKEREKIWNQELRQTGTVMTLSLETLHINQRQPLYEKQGSILRELKASSPPEIGDDFDVGVKSSDDFFEKLLALIDLIKNGYLAGYEHIIAAYSDFFADFNAEITAKMKDWIQGANDGKEVKINAGLIRLALERLIKKYSHPNPASVLFPAPGMDGATKEEAEKWRLALGLPENCLKQNADGTFSVVMDLGPLTIMMDSLPPNIYWITWDTSKFQAWQTGFNAQEERLKNMLQSFTQKYSNANSYHDNFNKTLSSHLNQYADMLKAMLNF